MRLYDDLFIVSSFHHGADICHATVYTNVEHPIYKAHFPGNPITPGVCILQMVSEMMERFMHRQLTLKEIRNVKYLQVLEPRKDVLITFRIKLMPVDPDKRGLFNVQATVSDDERVYTKLSLQYATL